MSERPDFWDDSIEAQKLMRERTRLSEQMDAITSLERDVSDAAELYELASEEGDTSVEAEILESLSVAVERAERAELEALLSGEADGNNCFLEIHAGAGGTESQDWAGMLRRMYSRWAQAHDMKVDEIEEHVGEEAGIKSSTLHIKGDNAYGWLKAESGVHRLVRISPFDSNARRHTSFASIWVFPEIDDSIEVEIPESEVRVDTYRASGAGGQHVNTTDSAVRLTYNMPGVEQPIVVQCQNERSQHKNRATAWNMLRARVYEIELQKREEAAQNQADSKTEIGWGNQIRSYVLQPYQMVKDLRTNVETSDSQGVLDGDLDKFLAASLSHSLEASSEAE